MQIRDNKFVDIILTSFDEEMARMMLSNEAMSKVLGEFFLERHLSRSCHVAFTTVNLYNIADQVMSNTHIRDFILELTDRVGVSISLSNLTIRALLESLVSGIISTRAAEENNQALMTPEIISSINISKESLEELFTDNIWIVVLYVLSMYLNHTVFYSTSLENWNKE